MKEKRACPKCLGTGAVPDDTKIGRRLKTRRIKAGVGLREIARRLDVTAPFVAYLENGERRWKGWEQKYQEALHGPR